MKMSLRKNWTCCLALLGGVAAATALLPGCAGNPGIAQTDALQQPASTAAPVADVAAVPQGVDPALWQQLSAELERVLKQEGTAKRSSAAPTGAGSAVGDFEFFDSNGTIYAFCSYHNQGDYNVDGLVTINDLTPVGIHFGKDSTATDWTSAQLADGDMNGVITIADVTPIGQNFGGRVDGFEIQSDDDSGFVELDTVMREELLSDLMAMPVLIKEIAPALDTTLRVMPFVEVNGARQYGVPGNEQRFAFIVAAASRQYRYNEQHTGNTVVQGIENPQHYWTLPLEGTFFPGHLISDNDGNIYLGTALFDAGLEFLDGYMYKIARDGTLEWRIATPGGILTAPALGRLGEIIVATRTGNILCFSSEGRLFWSKSTGLEFDGGNNPVLLDGNTVVLAGVDPDSDASTIFHLDNDGSEIWTAETPLHLDTSATVFNDAEDHIAIASFNDDFLYINGDGQFMPTPLLPQLVSSATPTFAADRLVLPGNNTRVYTVVPPAVAVNWHDTANDVTGPAAYSDEGFDKFIVATFDDVAGTSELIAFSPSGIFGWSIPLPSQVVGEIMVDGWDRVYAGVFDLDGVSPSGVYCFNNDDQTEQWFYDTGELAPASPVVTSYYQIVFALYDVTTDAVSLESVVDDVHFAH